MPFKLTDILRDEMLNLREENEGINIILKQANKRVKKDKFSAFEYGLYYIKLEEAKKRKKAGTLSNSEIDGFYNMLYPMLDDKQRKMLSKIVSDLKRI